MPSKNPRVNLTLPPELYSSLCAFADSQGTRPATVIRNILIEMQDSMDASTRALEVAKTDQNKAVKMIYNSFLTGISDVAQRSIFDLEESHGND